MLPTSIFALAFAGCACVSALSRSSHHEPASSHDLTVKTSSGTVHGIIDSKYPFTRQFLGIPYAQPPIASLRWEAPQALPSSAAANSINATTLPPSCPQYLTTLGNSIYKLDVLEYNLQGLNVTVAISEDCLTASVWTPVSDTTSSRHHQRSRKPNYSGPGGSSNSSLPVIIFIYGGGFTNGGEDVPAQIPTSWVNRTRDHIVVSFNYRVNIFGFPNAAGLSDQNLGILDQRLAIEWVRDNIAAFGGDPDRITLWGQSAGAMSVDFQQYAYYDDPIVNGLVMDSGTAFLPIRSYDTVHSNFTFVAENVGCSGFSQQPQAQLDCMRNVSMPTIETFLQQYQDNGTAPSVSFLPIADDKVIFSNYTQRSEQGLISKLPALIGTNAQDGVAFVPYNPNGPDQAAAQEELLSIFLCPSTETVRVRTAANLPVFRFEYAGNFTNLSPRPWMGAYHSSELPLLFGTYGDFGGGQTTELEAATSVAMQDAWVAFAGAGAQGVESTGWQPYVALAADVRQFGAGVAVQDTSLASLEAMCNGAVLAS